MANYLLDTDAGYNPDDFFATILLIKKLKRENRLHELLGVTTVHSLPVEKARMMKALLQSMGVDKPVYAGIGWRRKDHIDRLIKDFPGWAYNDDGFPFDVADPSSCPEAGINPSLSYPIDDVPLKNIAAFESNFAKFGQDFHAIPVHEQPDGTAARDAIIQSVHELKAFGEILTIIAIGALNNIASAIEKDPTIVDGIEIVSMGGWYLNADGTIRKPGTNHHMAPEATKKVLDSGVKITIVSSELVSHSEARIDAPTLQEFLKLIPFHQAQPGMMQAIMYQCLDTWIKAYGGESPQQRHSDPLTAIIALEPRVVAESSTHQVVYTDDMFALKLPEAMQQKSEHQALLAKMTHAQSYGVAGVNTTTVSAALKVLGPDALLKVIDDPRGNVTVVKSVHNAKQLSDEMTEALYDWFTPSSALIDKLVVNPNVSADTIQKLTMARPVNYGVGIVPIFKVEGTEYVTLAESVYGFYTLGFGGAVDPEDTRAIDAGIREWQEESYQGLADQIAVYSGLLNDLKANKNGYLDQFSELSGTTKDAVIEAINEFLALSTYLTPECQELLKRVGPQETTFDKPVLNQGFEKPLQAKYSKQKAFDWTRCNYFAPIDFQGDKATFQTVLAILNRIAQSTKKLSKVLYPVWRAVRASYSSHAKEQEANQFVQLVGTCWQGLSVFCENYSFVAVPKEALVAKILETRSQLEKLEYPLSWYQPIRIQPFGADESRIIPVSNPQVQGLLASETGEGWTYVRPLLSVENRAVSASPLPADGIFSVSATYTPQQGAAAATGAGDAAAQHSLVSGSTRRQPPSGAAAR